MIDNSRVGEGAISGARHFEMDERGINMKWKVWFAIGTIGLVCQTAIAQNSSGNMLTGDAKAEVITSYTGPATLLKTERVWVKDFTVRGDVVIDGSLAARMHRHSLLGGGSGDATPEGVVQQIETSFTKTLTGELKKQQMETDRMPDGVGALGGTYLIVEGEFIGVNEGDKTKRVMIGFGKGASDIKTHIIISLVENGNRTVVLESNLNSQSGKKPGAIIGLGGGNVAVGAVTGDVGDKKSTVLGDASRMAKVVAKQVEAVMIAQRWVPAPPPPPAPN